MTWRPERWTRVPASHDEDMDCDEIDDWMDRRARLTPRPRLPDDWQWEIDEDNTIDTDPPRT